MRTMSLLAVLLSFSAQAQVPPAPAIEIAVVIFDNGVENEFVTNVNGVFDFENVPYYQQAWLTFGGTYTKHAADATWTNDHYLLVKTIYTSFSLGADNPIEDVAVAGGVPNSFTTDAFPNCRSSGNFWWGNAGNVTVELHQKKVNGTWEVVAAKSAVFSY